ncbi:TPA: ATP-binding protein [Providencia rettgeri]|nr:ATP-binding protein [Providencia rettgeri]
MLCSISEIHMKLPYSSKIVDIKLNGSNLIITGGNGCGKTSFIKTIHSYLQDTITDPDNNDITVLQRRLSNAKNSVSHQGRDSSLYDHYQSIVNKTQIRINELENYQILTNIRDEKNTRSLLRFHDATRQASISSPNETPKHSVLVNNHKHFSNDKDGSNFFESYLLSLKKNQSYAIAFDKDQEEANRIEKWFNKIQTDLRSLFEDEKLVLEFNTKDEKFYLHQTDKDKYTFQTLSAGYSSILSIYTDLIMRVEMWEVTPDNIEGIIFIDEIDAHLHVSLQKQILRFFVKSFPKVQFIVTTHSPFVVTSIEDVVIYDLTANEQITDVSSYSYDVVMEEIFRVLPDSHILIEKLIKIEKLSENITADNIESLDKALAELASYQIRMSLNSQAFIDSVKLELTKKKNKLRK